MPKPMKGPRIGGSAAHQRIMLNNLASQLFEHGRITTTETRANSVQPLAEKLISKAKRGDIASRRLVLRRVTDKSVVHELFTEIAPKMAGRDGGYTRITKIGPRKGDNAPMAVIELITTPVVAKKAAPAAADVAAAINDAAAAEQAAATDLVEAAQAAADEIETAADAEVVADSADEAAAETADDQAKA